MDDRRDSPSPENPEWHADLGPWGDVGVPAPRAAGRSPAGRRGGAGHPRVPGPGAHLDEGPHVDHGPHLDQGHFDHGHFDQGPHLERAHAPIVALAVKALGEEGGRALDLGCGNGVLLGKIRARVGHRVIPYGIDCEPAHIDHARRLFPAFADNFWLADLSLGDALWREAGLSVSPSSASYGCWGCRPRPAHGCGRIYGRGPSTCSCTSTRPDPERRKI